VYVCAWGGDCVKPTPIQVCMFVYGGEGEEGAGMLVVKCS